MPIRYTVNAKGLSQDLMKSLSIKNSSTIIKNSLKLNNGELLSKKIDRLKAEMIKDFLSLPVTREIMAGPTSSNISGTLGGYGNLFSFIGFQKGSNPIDPIINLLNQTTYDISRVSPRGQIKLTITMPSSNDIFNATPVPWAPGLSWAQRIETGMPGLGSYLNKSSSSSRSGTGVQSGKKARAGKFLNSKYISHFLKKWQRVFLKIEKKISLI